MEAKINQSASLPPMRDRLRGAAAGALAAALCLVAVLIYPPVREVFYKGFGQISEAVPFDYIFPGDGSVTLTKYTGGTSSVTVPSEIGDAPVYALHSFVFQDQTYIARVVIAEGVTRVDALAAMRCPSLSEIVIPASVTEISANAFLHCAEDLTIYGVPGSAAESYARENELRFIPRG